MENAQRLGFPEQAQQPFTQPNSSRLIPYVCVDGEWTLPDEFMWALPVQMQREGTWSKVFYDGRIRTQADFIETLQKPANAPVFVFDGDEPLGFAWLNGFSGGLAFAHFCVFDAAKGRTEDIGRQVLRYWMSAFTFLHIILGLMPSSNRAARLFIRRIGFTTLGEIPNVLFDAYKGERVSAVVSYYAR